MATALASLSEAPAVDLFARALSAAQRMRMGTSERLRLESLRLTVSAKGVPTDDPRIAQWLAAALCSTREERAQFLQLCAIPGAQLQLVERVAENGAAPPAVEHEAAVQSDADQTSPWWRRPIAIAGFILLSVALAVIAAMVWPAAPDPSSDLGNVDLNAIAEVPPPQVAPPAEPVPMTTEYRLDWFGILLLAVPLFAAAWYIWRELSRRRELRRDFAPAPQQSLTLAFASGPEGLLGDPLARRALRRLRRHRPVPSRALDVSATIEATIATGGRPDLRFSTRPESPEYVVLAERESPRDHLAWLGGLLSARMREEQIATAHFEFLGDPRRLHRIERGALREVESLPGVIARHDRANMLLVVESYDCAVRDAASDWIDTLALTPSPALLDPRARGAWDADELWLARRGISAFTMSGAGLSAYADNLSGVPVATTAGNRQSVDLPTGFAKHREILVADTPPDPVIVSGLVDDLEDWLDRDGFEWLCALALFPYVDPGLTVHLGAALTDKAGRPLLEEARFLRLARLPWMREGRMPDWLRTMLVRRLPRDRLTAATAAIQAFLVPQEGGATRIDLGLGEDAGWRAKLLDWLRRRPSSVLADRLLIDALADRPPDQLGLEVAKPLRDRLAPLWTDRAIRAALLAVAAIVGIAIAAPPFRAVEVPLEIPADPLGQGKGSDLDAAAAAAADAAAAAADEATNAVVANATDATEDANAPAAPADDEPLPEALLPPNFDPNGSGSTGGGWEAPTKGSSKNPAPSKEPPVDAAPQQKQQQQQQQQHQQQQQQQAPSATDAGSSAETTDTAEPQDAEWTQVTRFSSDPPEKSAIAEVIRNFEIAQKVAPPTRALYGGVSITVESSDTRRIGYGVYGVNVARALISSGVPSGAITVGNSRYNRSMADFADKVGSEKQAYMSEPSATVSVTGRRSANLSQAK